MLLGISHQSSPSGGRIPPSLFDLYVQYKKDTRAIIAWLMSHGTSKFNNIHTISIRDLLGLAEVVQKKAVVMPDTIDFQFRQAIAARTQLSTFFRAKGGLEVAAEDTVNHEFFTERRAITSLPLSFPLLTRIVWGYSLAKIYTGLCECCAKPVKDCRRTSEQNSRNALRNRFSLLKLGTTDASCDCERESGSETDGAREGLPTVPRVDDTPQLIDDSLCDAIEVYKELQVQPPSLSSHLI